MARLGKKRPKQGSRPSVFALGFQWVKEILAWLCSPTDKRGILFFSFGRWCSRQCNWQKTHLACALLYKQLMWLVHCGSPMKAQLPRSTHLVSWKMRITHQASRGNCLQSSLRCSMGMEWGRENKGAPGTRPHLCFTADSRQSRRLCGQRKRIVWQFQLLVIEQLSQAWPLSWNRGGVLCSIAFLCHRQYHCSWRVHYFSNENGIFWRILSYIFEKENR